LLLLLQQLLLLVLLDQLHFLVVRDAQGLAVILDGAPVEEAEMRDEHASGHAAEVAAGLGAAERPHVGRNSLEIFEQFFAEVRLREVAVEVAVVLQPAADFMNQFRPLNSDKKVPDVI
jgi:hypothetical protein